MSAPREPLFLARETYKRRRLRDAARVMPVLGVLLFAAPVVWPETGTAEAWRYLFLSWLLLIVVAYWIGRRLMRAERADRAGGDR